MAWEYSEKTKRIFMDAVQGRPGTHLGEIEQADGVGEHGSIVCGDALKFMFRVRKDADPLKDVIVEARYLTFGCTSAIAASEALCALIEGKGLTPIEALNIRNQDIVDYLEGLPRQKIHCSVMGAEALEAAVVDWAQKRGVDLVAQGVKLSGEKAQEEGRVVCKCFGLTEPYLRRKIKELKLRTVEDIVSALKAGGMCGSCRYAQGGLQDILNEVWATACDQCPASGMCGSGGGAATDHGGGRAVRGGGAGESASAEGPGGEGTGRAPGEAKKAGAGGGETLSPYQLAKQIERVLEEEVRPALRRDGGDLELVDIKGWKVYVALKGACASCPGASRTLQLIVENTLKERVDAHIEVIPV